MSIRHLALGLVLLGALAHPAAAQKIRRDKNVITAEEIAKASGSTAFEVIRQLRPSWFVTRGVAGTQRQEPAGSATSSDVGGMTVPGIAVYVDGVKAGGTDELNSISVDRIKELHFYSANDATTKFGTGHPNGAIEVLTKR